MATFNLQRFTKVNTLRSINRQLLFQFLRPYKDFFLSRGVNLKSLESSENPEYGELVGVFMNPDADTPHDLAEALYFINEMATEDGMDQLLEEAEKREVHIDYLPESTPEDIAIQVWIADREIVERKHAEQFLTKPRSFEYYQSAAEPKPIGKITDEKLSRLEKDLNIYFIWKKRGKTCKVFAYPKNDETWFLVRRGEPYKREGSIKNGESKSIFYRPEAFDVVVYNETIGEIRINANVVWLKRIYRQFFGKHFFGDTDFFPGTQKYTLDPLRRDGAAALVCSDVEGLEWVLLKELHYYWGGPYCEIEIRKADNLFAAFESSNRSIQRKARMSKAKFQVKFNNAKRPRTLTIRPPNIANFTRDDDSVIGEIWLARRGFIMNAPEKNKGPQERKYKQNVFFESPMA